MNIALMPARAAIEVCVERIVKVTRVPSLNKCVVWLSDGNSFISFETAEAFLMRLRDY